ncbi:hypothetical protein DSECCO2_523150 [anaerobic digester metagenome]
MIFQRFIRDTVNLILQRLQIARPRYFGSIRRIHDSEIAESKIIEQKIGQFMQQGFGKFMNEFHFYSGSQFLCDGIRRLQQYRKIRVIRLYDFTQFDTRVFILYIIPVKRNVGNHPEHIRFIFFIQTQRLLKIGCQQYFRSAAQPQRALMLIETFGHECP